MRKRLAVVKKDAEGRQEAKLGGNSFFVTVGFDENVHKVFDKLFAPTGLPRLAEVANGLETVACVLIDLIVFN